MTDLIDRDALIHDIAYSIRLADEWAKEANEKGDRTDLKFAVDTHRSLLSMISRVKEFPTIEAEPVRHGEWIPTEYDSYADGVPVWDKWECSECGHEHNGEEDTLTAFCPDCGARMDADHIADDSKKVGGAENGEM